jgi:hypothetical protein
MTKKLDAGMYGQDAKYHGEFFVHPTRADARGFGQYPSWRETAEKQMGGKSQDYIKLPDRITPGMYGQQVPGIPDSARFVQSPFMQTSYGSMPQVPYGSMPSLSGAPGQYNLAAGYGWNSQMPAGMNPVVANGQAYAPQGPNAFNMNPTQSWNVGAASNGMTPFQQGIAKNSMGDVQAQLKLVQDQEAAQKMLTQQMELTKTATTGLEAPMRAVSTGASAATPALSSMSTATEGMVKSLEQSAASMSSGMGGAGMGLFSLFHAGGDVGSVPASGFRIASASLLSGAPRYHSGLTSAEYPAILKRGERVLTANDNQRNLSLIQGLSDRLEASQKNGAQTQGAFGSNSYKQQFVVYAQDANSFKKTQGQLMSDSAVQMRRMASRNT